MRPMPRLARALAAVGALALAACAGGGDAPRARIVEARLVADPEPVLEAELELVLSRVMLDALAQGIPLVLTLRAEARDDAATLVESRTMTLRYLPLARRWQLSDAAGDERHYARRAQLLAALDRVRVPLPEPWRAFVRDGELSLTLGFDRSALPGPLRIPATLRRDWRFPDATLAWHAGR